MQPDWLEPKLSAAIDKNMNLAANYDSKLNNRKEYASFFLGKDVGIGYLCALNILKQQIIDFVRLEMIIKENILAQME